MGKSIVECCTHGNRYPAYVCQHLNMHTPVGFYEPFASDPTLTYANDELSAWCEACDEVLTEAGEWNDESEGFAQIKLIYDVCFFEMKKLNQEYLTNLTKMEIAQMIEELPVNKQIVFCALNCEKILPSIAKFDEEEIKPVISVFERVISAIYIFSVSPSATLEEYEALKEETESFWPDLDESKNSFASYAFDAFGVMVEALNFVLSNNSDHTINCSNFVLDTVDMYVQETSETEPPAADLERFIQSSPFMTREVRRQLIILEELAKTPIIDSKSIAYLRSLNDEEMLIDFAAL